MVLKWREGISERFLWRKGREEDLLVLVFPMFFEEGVSAGCKSVEAIFYGASFIEILMVVISGVEGGKGSDFCYDGFIEDVGSFHFSFGLFCSDALVVIMIEYRSTVLLSSVRKLSVVVSWVYRAPKQG